MSMSGENSEKPAKSWGRVALTPLVFVFTVAVGIVIVLFSVVVLGPMLCIGRLAGLSFWRALKREGRFLDWATVEHRLVNGQGTLLVEWWSGGRGLAWWVPMSLAEMYPDIPLVRLAEMEPPADKDSASALYERALREDAAKWFAEKLSGHEDEFCLTRVPKKDRKDIHVLGKRLPADRAFVFSALSQDAPTRRIRPKSWRQRRRRQGSH
jgi:hypothetical protein